MQITNTALVNHALRPEENRPSTPQGLVPSGWRTPSPAIHSPLTLAGLAPPEQKIFWQEPSYDGLHSLTVNSRQKCAIEGALRRAGFCFVPRPPNPLKALPTEVLQLIGSQLEPGDFLRLREAGNVGAVVAARSMNSSAANVFVKRLLPFYFGKPNKRLGVPALGVVPTTHHTLLRCSLSVCDEVVSKPTIEKCFHIVEFLANECQGRNPLQRINLNCSKIAVDRFHKERFSLLFLSNLTQVTKSLTLGKYFDQKEVESAAQKSYFRFSNQDLQTLRLADFLCIPNLSTITLHENFCSSVGPDLKQDYLMYALLDRRDRYGSVLDSKDFAFHKLPLVRCLFEHKNLERVILEVKLKSLPEYMYQSPFDRSVCSPIVRSNIQWLIELARAAQIPHKKREICIKLNGSLSGEQDISEILRAYSQIREAGAAAFLTIQLQTKSDLGLDDFLVLTTKGPSTAAVTPQSAD